MNINATIFAQMVIFALLVWITVTWIWPMTLKNMVAREKRIADGLAALRLAEAIESSKGHSVVLA